MDPITIGLLVGLAVSAVANLVVVFRNNIRKSSCCFSSIEFKEGVMEAPKIDIQENNRNLHIFPSPTNATVGSPVNITITSI